MQIYTNIEIDNDELWQAVSEGVSQAISEDVPDLLDDLDTRAEWLEEKCQEVEYRVNELEDHQTDTEDHETRISELEGNSEIDKEMISALEAQVQVLENQIIRDGDRLEAQVQDLENQIIRPEHLAERIRRHVAEALADARIIL
jgi:predicted  nucleic acid-binding Zn-ribbon protein